MRFGGYEFRTPLPLDEARPPRKQGGVYIFLVKGSDECQGSVRYVGRTNDLQSRVNFGHNKISELMDEAKRKLERLLVTWQEVDCNARQILIEQSLIRHYGWRLLNTEKKGK